MIRVIKLFVVGMFLFLSSKMVALTFQSMFGLSPEMTAYLTGVLNGTLITSLIARLPEE